VNQAARARKKAFITKEMMRMIRKKVLFPKGKQINWRELREIGLQELASARLKPNDEVQHDRVRDEGRESDRDVDEGHGGGFYERMVHGCLLMAQD
jgi:hypothetical protein